MKQTKLKLKVLIAFSVGPMTGLFFLHMFEL